MQDRESGICSLHFAYTSHLNKSESCAKVLFQPAFGLNVLLMNTLCRSSQMCPEQHLCMIRAVILPVSAFQKSWGRSPNTESAFKSKKFMKKTNKKTCKVLFACYFESGPPKSHILNFFSAVEWSRNASYWNESRDYLLSTGPQKILLLGKKNLQTCWSF